MFRRLVRKFSKPDTDQYLFKKRLYQATFGSDRKSGDEVSATVKRELIPSAYRPLEVFYRLHANKSAVIIGNGPSVRVEDLPFFENLVSFSLNKFYLAHNKTPFRANYTVASDDQVLQDFGQDIAQKCNNTCFFCMSNKTGVQVPSNVYPILRLPPEPDNIRDLPFWGLSSYSSVVTLAIQLAFFMGIKTIFLYGLDHNVRFKKKVLFFDKNRSAKNDGNHFIEGYRMGRPWGPADPDAIELGFRYCQKFAEKNGRQIYNISRRSKLNIFQKKKFDSVFQSG